MRTPAGYAAAMTECARVVGLERVLAFHLNDAKAPLGSGLDRHEHIGRGRLGLRPFRLLMNDRRFARVPKVLETPKDPGIVPAVKQAVVTVLLRVIKLVPCFAVFQRDRGFTAQQRCRPGAVMRLETKSAVSLARSHLQHSI